MESIRVKISLRRTIYEYLVAIKNSFFLFISPVLIGSIVNYFLQRSIAKDIFFINMLSVFIESLIINAILVSNVLLLCKRDQSQITMRKTMKILALGIGFPIVFVLCSWLFEYLKITNGSLLVFVSIVFYIVVALMVFRIIELDNYKGTVGSILKENIGFYIKYIVVYFLWLLLMVFLFALLFSTFVPLEERPMLLPGIRVFAHSVFLPIAFLYLKEKRKQESELGIIN